MPNTVRAVPPKRQEVQRCTKPETGTKGTNGAEEGRTAKPPAPQRAKREQRWIDNKAPPPPYPHPRGKGKKKVRGRKACPPADKAAEWGGSRQRAHNHKAVPEGSSRRASPRWREHLGWVHRVQRATKGATGQTPPAEGQMPRLVPASCSQRAYAGGQKIRAPRPHASTHPGKGRGRRGDGKGT